MGQNCGALSLFGGGEPYPHLAQCGLDQGPPPCQVPPWSIQQFGHNRHGPKIGEGLSPIFWEGMGSHRTQSPLGWGLPPYQVASWRIQPFGYNRNGLKIGEGAPPPFLEGAGSPSNTKSHGLRPTSTPSTILIHFALWFLSSFFFLFFLAYLSGRRLDVYHTSTHGVALVRI